MLKMRKARERLTALGCAIVAATALASGSADAGDAKGTINYNGKGGPIGSGGADASARGPLASGSPAAAD